MIDAAGVTKTHDSGAGLRAMDLRVREGAVVGLIGPSGAGKTTAIRLLTGPLTRDEGDLTVLGVDPELFGTETRSRIGYLPQDTALYPTLSVRENIDFAAALQGMRGRKRAQACESALATVELDDVQDRRLDRLSGGMRRRAGLAAALVHNPDLLFLDEPTAGQDPILRRSVWDHLDRLGREGRTLVITTQHVGEAAYCDLIAVLADGEVIAIGEPEALRRDAYGGELVDVTFQFPPGSAVIDSIGRELEAERAVSLGSHSARFTVADAGTAIPRVAEAADRQGINVTETDRFLPDFDEVFVRLVDDHRNGSADS